MRIAQVAPLFERVPPLAYGGTERVVAYLTDALVELGHDVTLFASGDSSTRADLVAASDRSLRLDKTCRDTMAPQIRQLELVSRMAHRFDVIHFHTGYLHLPLTRHLAGALGDDDARAARLQRAGADDGRLRRLAVRLDFGPSAAARIRRQNWCATVYHGLPPRLLPFRPRRMTTSRSSAASRPRSVSTGRSRSPGAPACELRVAAKIDAVDREYFDREIGPLMSQPHVRYLGEIGDEEKAALLGGARALLFPIDWPEPFGMVVIEALSCGTPVLAWPEGSVPELLEHGVNGWIVDSIDAAVDALRQADAIDRRACRAAFERRFTAERMARDYVAVYKRLRESSRGRLEARTA